MNDKNPAIKPERKDKPEFSGKVNGVLVSASGAQLQFEVINKKDVARSFKLDSAMGSGFAVMSAIVTAAYAGGKKVAVTGEGEGVPVATAIRLGARPKEVKTKPAKPAKRIKGPILEVQAAASP